MYSVDKAVQESFLFALGEHVHWASGGEPWAHKWQILQQRCTVSMIAAWNDYLVISVTDPNHAPVWVCEPDLVAWHARQG